MPQRGSPVVEKSWRREKGQVWSNFSPLLHRSCLQHSSRVYLFYCRSEQFSVHSEVPTYCRVTPCSGENLSLLLHTSETRSLPRIATKRSTANSTQNTDDWQKQLQSTEITTHATHAPHVTHATHATRATHAFFAIFAIAKTRSLKKNAIHTSVEDPFWPNSAKTFTLLKLQISPD